MPTDAGGAGGARGRRGLVKVDGQGAVDGVTGGEERKTLAKRAFRGVCPQISRLGFGSNISSNSAFAK